MKACAAGPGSIFTTLTSLTLRPFFFRNQASVKYGAVPGAEAATVLPLRSLIDATLPRTTMPSAPKDLSSWNSCVVATPLAFHTTQVSTVVAAHCTSPDAIARCRLACGTFLMVTSRPFLAKMPASLASVSGAKPVQPEIAIVTLVCAEAGVASIAASPAATDIPINFITRSPQPGGFDTAWQHGGLPESILRNVRIRASSSPRPSGWRETRGELINVVRITDTHRRDH